MAVDRQWLSKHISVAMNTHATIEELLDTVSSVWSMLGLLVCNDKNKLGYYE
jgi:hypothetical protein